MIEPDLAAQLAQLGKGLVQANLKLSRLAELLERPRPDAHAPIAASKPAVSREPVSARDAGDALEALLDLVEAAEHALERRERGRGLLARLAGRAGEDVWRGLALARDAALERLARMGVEPVATEGELDPLVHRVVEVLPARNGRARGLVARTHRRGWVRRAAGGREVVRTAQVSVYGSDGA